MSRFSGNTNSTVSFSTDTFVSLGESVAPSFLVNVAEMKFKSSALSTILSVAVATYNRKHLNVVVIYF